MWPGRFERGLFLLRVEVASRSRHFVVCRRQSAEEVGRQHEGDVLKHILCKLSVPAVDVVHELEKGLPLDLLLADAHVRVREVEGVRAKHELSREQLLTLRRNHVAESGQWLGVSRRRGCRTHSCRTLARLLRPRTRPRRPRRRPAPGSRSRSCCPRLGRPRRACRCARRGVRLSSKLLLHAREHSFVKLLSPVVYPTPQP
mmetsp:Transcript_25508/g.84002  ORF Transcript_25508/g.84002 Transcript_25508/m.84002 type:complete len:201 (-) Transcript_25508:74-676(-)